MNKNRIFQTGVFFLIVIIIFFFSCNFNIKYLNRIEDKNEASAIISTVYKYIECEDYTKASELFDHEFLIKTPQIKLIKVFANLRSQLGKIESYTLEKWDTIVIKGRKNNGNYKLHYKVKREKAVTNEVWSLKKNELDGAIKVIRYQVDSESN